ncbi:MAG: hypothetical protein J1E81_04025 [Eubacterium sp.]|nr:hypothetical protein [Eubacterium sp.]
MTNTGDFRRYSVANDINVSIDKYFSASRTSTAPKYEPRHEETPEFKVGGNSNKKSRKDIEREQKATFATAFTLLISLVLVVAMLYGAISTMAKKNELTKEIGRYESKLTIAQSENVRLNSQLNSLVSMSMIDKYAVEELGMSKASANKMMFIDVSQYKTERQAAALRLIEQNKEQNKK